MSVPPPKKNDLVEFTIAHTITLCKRALARETDADSLPDLQSAKECLNSAILAIKQEAHKCEYCGEHLSLKRPSAKFCNSKCRRKAKGID